MSLVRFKRKWTVIGEGWFGEEVRDGDKSGVDLLQLWQYPQPLNGFQIERFETLISDLTATEDVLFSRIKKNSRYEIRRAEEKDAVPYELWERPDVAISREFAEFFLEFSHFKGLADIRGPRFDAYIAANRILLSRVCLPDGKPLSWHAYVTDSSRARLLYSASARGGEDSSMRNLIGRANRYQHWQDMKRFKASGIRTLDLGGWYPGNSDTEMLNINHFKEEFGGTHETNYHCTRPLTLKGRAYLHARKLRGSVQALRQSRAQPPAKAPPPREDATT